MKHVGWIAVSKEDESIAGKDRSIIYISYAKAIQSTAKAWTHQGYSYDKAKKLVLQHYKIEAVYIND